MCYIKCLIGLFRHLHNLHNTSCFCSVTAPSFRGEERKKPHNWFDSLPAVESIRSQIAFPAHWEHLAQATFTPGINACPGWSDRKQSAPSTGVNGVKCISKTRHVPITLTQTTFWGGQGRIWPCHIRSMNANAAWCAADSNKRPNNRWRIHNQRENV